MTNHHIRHNPAWGEGQIRTLIVDDSALSRRTINRLLETDESVRVVGTAEDGLQAIEAAKKLKPDLILLDLQMPRMNGLEATLELRKIHPETRIVVVTLHGDDDVALICHDIGASGFVAKDHLNQMLPAEIHRLFPDATTKVC
jgi:DNA-binding NarL/FixJ family response regulator